MSKPSTPQPGREEMVATALNEQGFLFSQLIRDTIRFGVPGIGNAHSPWEFVGSEYPVTAADGAQTRIDIVLRHARTRIFTLCVECKRAHPFYKQWVFFDKETANDGLRQFFFEYFRISTRPITNPANAQHGIVSPPAPVECDLFKLYTEVAVTRDGKASHTQTMEEAFLQVTRGASGLMAKQPGFEEASCVTAIPVVVTTAKLFEARFDMERVSLESGTIESKDLQLHPLAFCAVSYRANDSLRIASQFAPPPPRDMVSDLWHWQTRTVFVVQSESVISFLNWLDTNFVSRQ